MVIKRRERMAAAANGGSAMNKNAQADITAAHELDAIAAKLELMALTLKVAAITGDIEVAKVAVTGANECLARWQLARTVLGIHGIGS